MNEYRITVEFPNGNKTSINFYANKNSNNFTLTVIGLQELVKSLFGDGDFISEVNRCDIDFLRIINV